MARRAPTDVIVAIGRLSRPSLWLVCLLPLWVGRLLAAREVAPSSAGAARLALACLVMGPLVGGATLAINDVHDLASDRRNPRKAGSPLVEGMLSRTAVRAAAYGYAVFALGLAAALGLAFAVPVAAFLVLAWAYSVPPLRLKSRPGADVATNAVGIGALPLLAGWALERPLGECPWWFLAQSVVVAIALYVPTTVVDHDADRAAGETTFATRLGPRVAYRVGFAAWVVAGAGTLALTVTDIVIPRSMLGLMAVFVPVLVVEYHLLIGRAPTSAGMTRGIILLSITFLVPSAAFALVYTSQ